MPTLRINRPPSPVSKPWTPFLRTRGSRNYGQRQRPQQAKWEFRRCDGASAERQTPHGIAERRFEHWHPRSPLLPSWTLGECAVGLGLGENTQLVLGQQLTSALLLKRFMVYTAVGGVCSMGR